MKDGEVAANVNLRMNMFKIALLPHDVKTRGVYLGSRKLPSNYMADFSLMGFVVDRYEDALTVIKSSGYRVDMLVAGSDIRVEKSEDLTEIQALLQRNNICCDYSDIADSLYQA